MSKLTVVYLTDTWHVLAALARTEPPQIAEPASALVGSGLPVRFIGTLPADATVSAQDLAVATVDDQPEVVVSPQSFKVVFDSQGKPQVQNAGAAGQVKLTITATAGATVSGVNVSLPARVGLQKVTSSSLAPAVLSPVTVGLGGTVVAGPAGFAANDTWNMYVLVQGLQPVAQLITVKP